MQHLGQKVWLIQHALIDNFLWVGLLLCLVLSPDAGGLRTRLRDLEGVYVLKLYQEDPSLFGASLTLTLTLWCLLPQLKISTVINAENSCLTLE